jgi:hypothetical protein
MPATETWPHIFQVFRGDPKLGNWGEDHRLREEWLDEQNCAEIDYIAECVKGRYRKEDGAIHARIAGVSPRSSCSSE